MRSLSINVTGVGPHTIVPAVPGSRIIVSRMILTFSHSEPKAQPITFYSGADAFIGPFYVLDGGEIEYNRRQSDENNIAVGEPFRIGLAANLSAAGNVFYDLGSQ